MISQFAPALKSPQRALGRAHRSLGEIPPLSRDTSCRCARKQLEGNNSQGGGHLQVGTQHVVQKRKGLRTHSKLAVSSSLPHSGLIGGVTARFSRSENTMLANHLCFFTSSAPFYKTWQRHRRGSQSGRLLIRSNSHENERVLGLRLLDLVLLGWRCVASRCAEMNCRRAFVKRKGGRAMSCHRCG